MLIYSDNVFPENPNLQSNDVVYGQVLRGCLYCAESICESVQINPIIFVHTLSFVCMVSAILIKTESRSLWLSSWCCVFVVSLSS